LTRDNTVPCLLTGCKSDSPNTGNAANTPCDHTTAACPHAVEIEINDTPATNDDLVQLKCSNPATTHTRHKVPCRIRLTGSATVDLNVVLTNPDGRLRFPEAGDTTKALTLPSSGAWVSFEISGEVASNAIGDAKIEAHANSAGGAIKARKDVTVFWFDQDEMKVTPGGNYALTGGRYTANGGNGVDFSAKSRIRPAGVDCSAPQISKLKVGMIQNAKPGRRRQTTWNTPTIAWNPGVAAGTTVTVPTTMRLTKNRPVLANDSETSVAPLYDQPGKTGTLDANSLKPPIGCSGGAAATSNDTLSSPSPPTFTVPAVTSTGTSIGTVTYTFVSTTVDTDFVIWSVIFNTTNNELCVRRERTWSIHADSASATPQRATTPATDSAPTAPPVTSPPFSNDVVNDPANETVGPVGGATRTFRK
jgi:hypothetical protein